MMKLVIILIVLLLVSFAAC
ncbi:type I toxin-antitoxin system Ibs family toxin [Escherichia coli]